MANETQGYGFIQRLDGVWAPTPGTSTTASAWAVGDYNNITFQAVMTGSASSVGSTGSFAIESSLDNAHWWNDFILNTTGTGSVSTASLSVRRGYIRASQTGSGNATSSLYILAGP